jgi:hypothetical protein
MTIGLTAAELAAIRSDVNNLLPDTCEIQEMVVSSNDVGEPSRTYSARGTAIACRLDPEIQANSAFEYLGGFADTVKSTGNFRLTLKHDQTIEITDRVVCNGVTYEVIAVDPGKSWKASTRASLQQVSP